MSQSLLVSQIKRNLKKEGRKFEYKQRGIYDYFRIEGCMEKKHSFLICIYKQDEILKTAEMMIGCASKRKRCYDGIVKEFFIQRFDIIPKDWNLVAVVPVRSIKIYEGKYSILNPTKEELLLMLDVCKESLKEKYANK